MVIRETIKNMNVFRAAADILHLLSILLLLLKMMGTRSVEGVSLKTQELYLVVYLTRYMDLFFASHSFSGLDIYNSLMKTVFIGLTILIIYLFAILPCAILALIIHSRFTVMEVFWTFSIYLEALAILPQLIMVQRYGNVENLTSQYIACLGSYRALYVVNWIYKYMFEPGYLSTKEHWIVWISGVIQTALYCDFFYYFVLSKVKGRTMLPK
eukprot:maker-scaffold_1-snap-gene-28.27-mRNA-1 protein AED:0.12 eAED:0.12 QI:40/0.5/0.33/1/0/0/3/0/211